MNRLINKFCSKLSFDFFYLINEKLIDSHRVLSLRRTALKPLLRADQPPTDRRIFKLGFRRFNPYIRR